MKCCMESHYLKPESYLMDIVDLYLDKEKIKTPSLY